MNLHEAVEKDDVDAVRTLLANGADPKGRVHNATPLHNARSKEVAELLVQHGAEVDALDGGDSTPLQNAAYRNHEAVAAVLLNHGADVNARKNPSQETPLKLAASKCTSSFAMLLLRHGAEVDAFSKSGNTPLISAAENDNAEVVEVLLQHGADPDAGEGFSDDGPARACATGRSAEIINKFKPRAPERYSSTPRPSSTAPSKSSNRIPAGICGILLGAFGVHKFILGYTTPGVIMLLATLLTCGYGGFIVAIIGLIEGIIYLTQSDEQFIQKYITNKRHWF